MEELPLTLNDFEFPRTKVNIKEIKKFDSEDQFMSLAVELFKEVCQITALLSCTYRLDQDGNPRKWTRNEAILGGLMVRTSKLQLALLEQICQKRLEITFIIDRCLSESLINLKYLLQRDNDNLFEEYIEYSLREEKRLLKRIEENITKPGHELPIESRMIHSIRQAFKTSSFTPEQVDETKWKPWGEKIYERAKSIGMEDTYFPYGNAWGVHYRSYSGWTSSQMVEHDWAMITLDRNVGAFTGWMGRQTASSSSSIYDNLI